MQYQIVRSQKEIDAVLNRVAEADAEGTTAFGGMTFEQGIKYAIEWLTNKNAPHPIDEE